ncbi:MAG: tRNA (adenosine(37)-N6)-dimethylallyltransferase MiaA [Alphaproteobacteria bacterium TMED194]|nr:MAG: tRNA (adenosine(37)-N6)-dimethylallyltransferase MiaA [Alphaproteobacteria bacterium TMED194]
MSSTINFEKKLDISLDNFCWQNDAIIIAGPTCVGKSAIAIALAKKINGVILNADSVQVYKNLKILSARPSEEEIQDIPHFLYGYVDGSNNFSVADWLFDLKTALKKVQLSKKVPIIVGGSGLYINAVINGLSKIPDISEDNKNLSLNKFNEIGFERFMQLNSQIDSEFVKINSDKQRLLRAYSVFLQTEKNMTFWHKQPREGKLEKNILSIFINSERKLIYKNCDFRFDKMLEKGALAEVENLWKIKIDRSLPISKSLGVKWLLRYLDKSMSYKDAVNLSKRDTRRFVKRQFTWFNHNFIPNIIINN